MEEEKIIGHGGLYKMFLFMILRNDSGSKETAVHQLDEIGIGVENEMQEGFCIQDLFPPSQINKENNFTVIRQKHYAHYYKGTGKMKVTRPVIYADKYDEQSLYRLLSELKQNENVKCKTSYCMGWDSACEWEGIVDVTEDYIATILELLSKANPVA